MEQKRTRGRPRKTIKTDTPKKEEQRNKDKKDENIVLFLALSDSEKNSDDNNGFTVNESEHLSNKIKSVSSNDDITSESSGEIYDKKQMTIRTLIAEIKKRDVIIGNLKKNRYGGGTYSRDSTTNIEYHSVLMANMEGGIFKPSKTDKLCWWCNDKFNTLPVYIPNYYKKNTFYVFGNCCSFECAVSYNITHLNDYKCMTRHTLLNSMKYKITGDNTPVKFAPPPELLIDRGGTQTRELYKKNLTHISNKFKINMPPIIPLVHIL